jgi:hypothetical protein
VDRSAATEVLGLGIDGVDPVESSDAFAALLGEK